MKIFVSYSRRDAGDFAAQIQRHLPSFKYNVFTDVDSIRAGDVWSNIIESNISNCDIFVVIVTYGALESQHVANEVLQAQRENKTIIPCFHRTVINSDIKWGLERIQGVEFNNEFQLARDLHSKIVYSTARYQSPDNDLDSLHKAVDNKKTTPKILKETDIAATKPTTSDIDRRFDQQKDSPQPPKGNIEEVKSSKPLEDITASIYKKEQEEKRSSEKDIKKQAHGIFGSLKTANDAKSNDAKYNMYDNNTLQQKKDTLQPSKERTGAIGAGVSAKTSEAIDKTKVQSTPKYTATQYDNNKIKYTERDSSRPSQGINLKLIMIPLIAIAIIGLIVSISYFSGLPSDDNKRTGTTPETIEQQIIPSDNMSVTDNGDGFLVYENSSFGIRVEYPSNWETFTISQRYSMYSGGTYIVGFMLPDQSEIFHIEVVDPGTSFNDYIASEIDFNKNISFVKNLETKEVKVSGYPAFKIVYTTADTNPSGKYMHLLVKVDSLVYFLTYASDIERYSEYLPLVQKMIDSLQINRTGDGLSSSVFGYNMTVPN